MSPALDTTLIKRPPAVLLLLCLSLPATAQPAATSEADFLNAYRPKAIEKWEEAMVALDARNNDELDPHDGVLFIGSSSIRRWDDIAIDMAPYRTIQRGYGGAKYSDLAVFTQRLIHPHKYRALVIFVGNDVSGKPTDHSPEEVEKLVRYVVGTSHAHQPAAPGFLDRGHPHGKTLECLG